MHIVGMGHAHPPTEIDNSFLESLDIGLEAGWIIDRIGITHRRTVLPLDYLRATHNRDPRQAFELLQQTPTDLALEASQMALQRAGLEPAQIGTIIANCCTPLQTVPAEAQRLGHALGLKVRAFDVFGACPAFALHLSLLGAMGDALPEYTLCVSTATFTAAIDYSQGSDGAILSDGAAAWIVSSSDARGLRVREACYDSDPTRSPAITLARFGHFHQDGRAVRSFSVRKTVRQLKDLQARHGLDWNQCHFVGHQANEVMLQSVCNHCKIPDSNHWRNVKTFGNQAGAGAPATLSMQWSHLSTGDQVAVAVVGAGLGWGTVLLEAI